MTPLKIDSDLSARPSPPSLPQSPIPSIEPSNSTLSFLSVLVLTNFSTDVKSLDLNARKAVTDTYNLLLALPENSTSYEMDRIGQTTVETQRSTIHLEGRGDTQPDIFIYLRIGVLLDYYSNRFRDAASLYHALHSNLTTSFKSEEFLEVLRHQFRNRNEPSFFYVTVVNVTDIFGQLNSLSSAPSIAPFDIQHESSQIYSELIILTSSALIIAAFILSAFILYKIAQATLKPARQSELDNGSVVAASEAETCECSDTSIGNAGRRPSTSSSSVASAMQNISYQDEMQRSSSVRSLDAPSFDSQSTEGNPFNSNRRFRESSSVHGNSVYFRQSSLASRISDEDVGYNFDNHQLILDFGKLRSALTAGSLEGSRSGSSDLTASDTASATVLRQKESSLSMSSGVYGDRKGRSTTIDVGDVYSKDSQVG